MALRSPDGLTEDVMALMPEYADGKLRPDGQLKGQLSLNDVE